ncbi:MAG TPA: hypothetical protein VFN28_11095, partial [Amaricoccus sp.]|nr:hypothetical protein [Amaricoccus sp.]
MDQSPDTSASIPVGTGDDIVSLDGIAARFGVVLTGRDAAGQPVSRFRPGPDAADAAPAVVLAPGLGTAPQVGVPVAVLPGGWRGAPALGLAWLRDGAAIPGATGLTYRPEPADDGRLLAVRVTATNALGTTVAETPASRVVRPAPVAARPLADVTADLGGAAITVAAAAAFDGAGLTFAVSGAGATIDSATGVVTISTGTLLTQERITVTATNSGGSAASGFSLTVRPSLPAVVTAPALSGTGRIGAPVTVSTGTWSGGPSLACQWLAGGVAIAGATGASYTPVAADD